ncbi:hypothetical protein WH7805_08116 [Synechococcus sp. WH 7805]|nr:hypothetical protein WH7805_08116 [Synechococcus sp. WH 7805]
MHPGTQVAGEMQDADFQVVILMKRQHEITLIRVHHPAGCGL